MWVQHPSTESELKIKLVRVTSSAKLPNLKSWGPISANHHAYLKLKTLMKDRNA